MDEAIEDAIPNRRGRETGEPVRHRYLRSDQSGGTPIAVIENFEQVLGIGYRNGVAHPIVQDEQVNASQAVEQFTQEMSGPRKNEHAASRKRLGIQQETAFLQQTPMGDMAVIITEADKDVGQLFQALAQSSDPFDVWFREQLKELHGLDVIQPPPGPPPEKYFDYRAP